MKLKEVIFWSVLVGVCGVASAHQYGFGKLELTQALSTLPYVLLFGCGVGATIVALNRTLNWVSDDSPLEWRKNGFLFIVFAAAIPAMYISGWALWQGWFMLTL